MSKSSRKVDRKRKSTQNVAYKSGNRMEVNKQKRVARHKRRMERIAAKKARRVERAKEAVNRLARRIHKAAAAKVTGAAAS